MARSKNNRFSRVNRLQAAFSNPTGPGLPGPVSPPPFHDIPPWVPRGPAAHAVSNTKMTNVPKIESERAQNFLRDVADVSSRVQAVHQRREQAEEETEDYIPLNPRNQSDYSFKPQYHSSNKQNLCAQSTSPFLNVRNPKNPHSQSFQGPTALQNSAANEQTASDNNTTTPALSQGTIQTGKTHHEPQNESENHQAAANAPPPNTQTTSERNRAGPWQATRGQKQFKNAAPNGVTKRQHKRANRRRNQLLYSAASANTHTAPVDTSDNGGPRGFRATVDQHPTEQTPPNSTTNSDQILRGMIQGHKAEIELLKYLLRAKGVDQPAIDEIVLRTAGGELLPEATKHVLGV